jgi:hypothetical protein
VFTRTPTVGPAPHRSRPSLRQRFTTVKLLLEVLALLVGLIAAILSLLGLARK